MRTREEHMAWCKERALQYVEAGDMTEAFASLISDLRKHDDTVNHAAGELGAMLFFAGRLSSAAQMREFIEGCN